MCYRIVTMAVLPLLLTRFSKWESDFECAGDRNVGAGKPAPTLSESVLGQAFQADKRAGGQQFAERLTVGQLQRDGRQFSQSWR